MDDVGNSYFYCPHKNLIQDWLKSEANMEILWKETMKYMYMEHICPGSMVELPNALADVCPLDDS